MHLNPQYLTAAGVVTAVIIGAGISLARIKERWAWRTLARRYQEDQNQCPSDQS